ncbi:CHASE3 domain-containing protein [Algibacter sp.]|uniref:CHASE3 domain-containing protein n=1 Tax=Algibacter sp. TaxID=1872428 RepID=UPI003C72C3EA
MRLLKYSGLFLKTTFFISVFIILVIVGFAYKQLDGLTDSTNVLVTTYRVNVELEQVLSHLKDAESGHRSYIVTKDTLYLEPYFSARENINNSFAVLKELTKETNNQKENLAVLNKLTDNLLTNFSKTYNVVEKNEMHTDNFKTLFFEEKIIIDSVKKQIDAMIYLEDAMLKERQEEYKEDIRFTPVFFYFVILTTLVLIIIAYFKITNDFKKIKQINDELLIFQESTYQSEIIGKNGSWILHMNSNTFSYSDNLYRLLGEKPKAFSPSLNNYFRFVHPEDLDGFKEDIDKMLKGEDLAFINYRVIHKNGDVRHFKAFGKTFYASDGQKQLLFTTTDITDEIQSMLMLEVHNLELERNNKELSDFNYVASHDLQEPLRKIQTFISRFEEKESDNFTKSGLQYLDRIKVSADRMRLLIDDLLQFSRTNKPDKAFVQSDLNELLENAKQDVAEIILDKKAQITSDVLPSISVIPFQIQQLFLNLLSNSLKYAKKNTPPIIAIAYSKVMSTEEDHLQNSPKKYYHKIVFSDNGIGFNQNYANKIFELFSRLHSKNDFSGTGVGLAICKKIADNHNGFIFANGQLNKGAIFTVYLPVV